MTTTTAPAVSERDGHVTTVMASPSPDAPASSSGGIRKTPRQQRMGDYVLLDEIGRGGMGIVFRAYDTKLRRVVAIKTLLGSLGQDPDVVARFGREARACARLRHPNIVALHHVGEYQGLPYLVMDYIHGDTWSEAMKSQRPTAREAADIVKQVAEALNHAHRAGITHRDVKPHNVMIDAMGRPLLMDFGLALDSISDSRVTRTGQLMGTPAYMAPEQVRGSRGDARTDVYALGVMLYQALAGRLPFRASQSAAILKQVLFDDPPALRDIDSKIHPDLDTIVSTCLQKEPDGRYISAAEVARELGRFLAGEAILARPLSLRQRGSRWARRNRLAAVSLAGLVLLAMLVPVAVVRTRNEAARIERERIVNARKVKLEEEVKSVLRRARLGEIFASQFERDSALFTLIQYPEPRTVELVVEALDAVTQVLSRGSDLGTNQEDLVLFLCQALPGIGISEVAVDGLGRYLAQERNDLRAVFACLALCHLGGAQAQDHVAGAKQRFGPDSPFAGQMRLAGVAFGEEINFESKDAVAFAHRGLKRYLEGDLFGAYADLRQVAETDPSILYAWLIVMRKFEIPLQPLTRR